jgi:hypothetical protein
MERRSSLRKVFGLYEHELNPWLEQALRRVRRVIDVGANDGYFAFGAAAAFRRLAKPGEIFAFEPQARHVHELRESIGAQRTSDIRLEIIHALVGSEVTQGMTTLDALSTGDRQDTLVKIDVEGAELDVIAGASSWMDRSNLFVIEVHQKHFIADLQSSFAARGHRLVRVDQRPLPLLGREMRDVHNWWLVSDDVTGGM